MNARDRERITNAVDFWITTKLGQQELSEATGRAQGGARAAVTGGRHLAGVSRLIVEELQDLGLTGHTCCTDRRATAPGYHRVSKSWDLLVLNNGIPVLATEYKSMAGSEGKNLNNRAAEVIGAAQDLERAQELGLVPATMLRGYVLPHGDHSGAQEPVGTTDGTGRPRHGDHSGGSETCWSQNADRCPRSRVQGRRLRGPHGDHVRASQGGRPLRHGLGARCHPQSHRIPGASRHCRPEPVHDGPTPGTLLKPKSPGLGAGRGLSTGSSPARRPAGSRRARRRRGPRRCSR